MKFIIAALLVLSPLSHAERRQQLDPKLQELLENLFDLDSLVEPSIEEQAREILYSGIQKKVIEATNVNPLIQPIMLSICADQKAKRNGQQKFRLDPSHISEVAEYDAEMYVVSSLIAFTNSQESSLLENATDSTFADLADDFLFHCVEEMHEELKQTNVAAPDVELVNRVQTDLINRAKKIYGEWNFLLDGKAIDSFNAHAKEHYEDTVARIQRAIDDKANRNSMTNSRVRAVKYSRPAVRSSSRGSI